MTTNRVTLPDESVETLDSPTAYEFAVAGLDSIGWVVLEWFEDESDAVWSPEHNRFPGTTVILAVEDADDEEGGIK